MQRPSRNYYERRPLIPSTRYKLNMPRNQNFRPGSFSHQNIQSYDYQYWCETCDKGFTTAHFLNNHKRQHQKCNIDGCQFIAHPKIITKHIEMQHSTGLYKRIGKLNNPEDIKKWREERKRKYPTLENIKKKQAEIKEKISRGEKMGIKYERSRKNEKPDFHTKTNRRPQISQTNQLKQAQGNYNKHITNNRKRVTTDLSKNTDLPKKICKIVPPKEEARKLKPFAGIQFININDDDLDAEILETPCGDLIADEEDLHDSYDNKKDTTTAEPTVCSALTSLICSYGSSDDDDDDDDDDNGKNTPYKENDFEKLNSPVNKTKTLSTVNINKTGTKTAEQTSEDKSVKQGSYNIVLNDQINSDDDSGPEEIQIIKEDPGLPIENCIANGVNVKKESLPKQINRVLSKNHEIRKKNKLPSTLLEKLLHREIQQERNIILQCVRYIVKNNYFE